MGKLIDIPGLSEFKAKLLNLIKPQLDASVSTVNSKSATNHAVVINADDIKMSSSENVTIPNKLKQYVKSVNGSTPDPITGDVIVAGGGGDTSVGLIRRSIGIATTAWQGSGPFTYTYSDPDIAVGMCVLEAYLSDEYAQLGINSYTIQNGSLIISTTVKPTDDWNLTIALGMDGSTFMEDVSDLKTKVGNGSLDTEATTLIGAVNELDSEIVNLQDGLAIIVDGDTASVAVNVGEYAYVKNNTHGLSEGVYQNTSSSVFPVSGGTADSTIFTKILKGINDYLPKISSIYKYAFQLGVKCNAHSEINAGNVYSIFNLPSYANILGVFVRNTSGGIATTFVHYVLRGNLYFRTGEEFTPGTTAEISFYALYI